MSVVRLTYRQILKRVHQLSSKYDEPSHMCFSVFGIMLRLDDFSAAEYGETPQQMIRSIFLRPSIAGLASDSPAMRLSAAFDVLRRLNDAAPLAEELKGVAKKNLSAKLTNPPLGEELTSAEKKEAHDGEEVTSSHAGADDALEKITVSEGTIFIESSANSKVRKISRHVFCSMFLNLLPPYRLTIPPEPMYTMNMRTSFKFPLMVDALLCMSAFANTCNSGPCKVVVRMDINTKEGYRALCESIPTRTVTVTDHVEIEVQTEYVCSKVLDENEDCETSHEDDNQEIITRSSHTDNVSPLTENVFRYFVFIRNYGVNRNLKKWHTQLLSRHWVIFDEEVGNVAEVIGPGVVGVFPMLAPGESHAYESGLTLRGNFGVMRGTFQLNVYNEYGESRRIDVYIGPTRLSRGNDATTGGSVK